MSEEEKFSFPLNDDFTPLEETNNEENEQESTTEGKVEDTKEDQAETETEGSEEEKSEDTKEVEGSASEDKEDGLVEGEVKEKDNDNEDKVEGESAVDDKETESSLNDISELTEGKYESVQEMYEALEAKNNSLQGSTVLEQMNSQIEEKFGEGISLSDIVSYQSKDFDEMNSFDVLTEHLQLNDPEITDREIRSELRPFALLNKSKEEIDEMIEDGDITEDDIEDLEAALDRKVRVARRDLKEFQSDINIDDLEVYSPQENAQQSTGKSQEELEKDAEYYESVISKFSRKDVDVGTKDDPHTLTIEATDDDRNGFRDFISDGENGEPWITKRWMMEDGRVDMDKLQSDIDKIINYERNIKIAFTQGKTAGASKEVKDVSNVDFGTGKNKPKSDEGLSQEAQIANEIN